MLQIYRDCRDTDHQQVPGGSQAAPGLCSWPSRRLQSGTTRTDAQGLRRIYDFLDAWGLINYEAADGPAHGLSSLPAVVASSGKPAEGLLVIWQPQPHRQTGARAGTCLTPGSWGVYGG